MWILRVLAKLVCYLALFLLIIVIREIKLEYTKWTGKKMDSVKHQNKHIRAIRKWLGDQDKEKKAKTYGQENFSCLAI